MTIKKTTDIQMNMMLKMILQILNDSNDLPEAIKKIEDLIEK